MNQRSLHIVCHNVPWPADHGGFFDLFYKIKALREKGISIKLHCFQYGKPADDHLKEFCSEVHYYERKIGMGAISLRLPYIVNSRLNPELLRNLQRDNDPILLEGIHCCGYVRELMSNQRSVLLRLHNVEHHYYSKLAGHEKNILRKAYYAFESILLKRFENNLPKSLPVLPVSKKDEHYYRDILGFPNTMFLPVFIPFRIRQDIAGPGDFALYHGNLAISENEKAVEWMLENIREVNLMIAGRDPSSRLRNLIRRKANITLVANPSDAELEKLISNAQVNVLPSFNSTGLKLKLIHALFRGNHCITNEEGAVGSGVEDIVAKGPNDQLPELVKKFMKLSFTESELNRRNILLQTLFDNAKNADWLIQLIWKRYQ